MFTLIFALSFLVPSTLVLLFTLVRTLMVVRASEAPYVADATDSEAWATDLEWDLECCEEYEHDTLEAIDAVYTAILETLITLDAVGAEPSVPTLVRVFNAALVWVRAWGQSSPWISVDPGLEEDMWFDVGEASD